MRRLSEAFAKDGEQRGKSHIELESSKTSVNSYRFVKLYDAICYMDRVIFIYIHKIRYRS